MLFIAHLHKLRSYWTSQVANSSKFGVSCKYGYGLIGAIWLEMNDVIYLSTENRNLLLFLLFLEKKEFIERNYKNVSLSIFCSGRYTIIVLLKRFQQR